MSTKNIATNEINIKELPQTRNIRGSDGRFLFLFVPFGSINLRDAIDDILEKGNGDLIVDAVIKQKSWNVILFGWEKIEVKGNVIDTNPKLYEKPAQITENSKKPLKITEAVVLENKAETTPQKTIADDKAVIEQSAGQKTLEKDFDESEKEKAVKKAIEDSEKDKMVGREVVEDSKKQSTNIGGSDE